MVAKRLIWDLEGAKKLLTDSGRATERTFEEWKKGLPGGTQLPTLSFALVEEKLAHSSQCRCRECGFQ